MRVCAHLSVFVRCGGATSVGEHITCREIKSCEFFLVSLLLACCVGFVDAAGARYCAAGCVTLCVLCAYLGVWVRVCACTESVLVRDREQRILSVVFAFVFGLAVAVAVAVAVFVRGASGRVRACDWRQGRASMRAWANWCFALGVCARQRAR